MTWMSVGLAISDEVQRLPKPLSSGWTRPGFSNRSIFSPSPLRHDRRPGQFEAARSNFRVERYFCRPRGLGRSKSSVPWRRRAGAERKATAHRHSGDPTWKRPGARSTGENSVHALGDVLEPSRVAAGNLGDAPAAKADFIQRLHDRRPVVVAFEQGNVEALPQAFLVAPFAAEFLDVERDDALVENADPLFGPAGVDDVADIEVPANPRALKFVHVARRLQRAEQKLVPDVFDGDFDAQFFGQRHSLADFDLRPGVGLRIGNLFVDDRRHEQHGGTA